MGGQNLVYSRVCKLVFLWIFFSINSAIIANIIPQATPPNSPNVDIPQKVVLLKKPHYYVALVAVFRDEAMFLKEWIEFYRLMGVEHFYLYNHLSKDNFQEILQPYIDAGIVELGNISQEIKTWGEWNTLQCKIYADTCKKVKDDVEWLVAVDTDEFLFPVQEGNLITVLKNYDDVAALSVNWKMYGSDTLEDLNPGELLTELLTKSSQVAAEDVHVKTIVKPRYVDTFTNPHYPELQKGFSQINEHREPLKGPFLKTPSRDILRINHYWTRTWKFFRETKLKRVHMVDDIAKIIERVKSYSVTPDTAILRFVPALKERMNTPISQTPNPQNQ
jgi:hypothetical protein